MSETHEIAVLLNRMSRIAHAAQFSHGLNPAQWEALRYIDRANRYSASPSALAEYVGATKGTVSQTLISLESKGYVTRVRDNCDRRKVTLVLTEAGVAMLGKDPLDQFVNAADSIGGQDREMVVSALRSMLNDLCLRQGARNFGVCGDCCHLRKSSEEGCGGNCGITGDNLVFEELDRLCANFERSELR